MAQIEFTNKKWTFSMNGFRKVLHSKIHRATVTEANVDYEGSITLPPELLEAANFSEFEAVWIWNVTNGNRFETYTIRGELNSRGICVNGAAAHLVSPGDTIIIASFAMLPEYSLRDHRPTIVFVDESNNIKEIRPEIPGGHLANSSARAYREQGLL